MKNNELKNFLKEESSDEIQFCESDKKNQLSLFFSSSIKMTDIVNILCSIDTITSAAKLIRESLKNIDFGLQDKFCDSEELKQSY